MTTPGPQDVLHNALEARAKRGTERGATTVVEAADRAADEGPEIGAASRADRQPEPQRRPGVLQRVVAVAAVLVLVVGAGIILARSRHDPTTATTGDPSISTPTNAGVWETLPGTLTTDQRFFAPTPIWTGREVLLPGLLTDPKYGAFTQVPAWNPVAGQARLVAAPR